MPKARTVRVRGLPPVSHEEAKELLETFIKQRTGAGEWPPLVTIMPSCDARIQKLEALVDFKDGNFPKFLSADSKEMHEKHLTKLDGRTISFDPSFDGFTQLSNPEPANSAIADIIAITGIGGHAYGSWATKHGMWLRDSLAEDLPHFRTMIYGYNTRLSGDSGGNLDQYVERFLQELKFVRASEETRNRPLFFITHSFGGLLFMRALVLAQADQEHGDPAIASLYKATYGVMFMAVPQRGIDFAHLVEELKKEDHPLIALLHDIQKDSRILEQLLRRFKDILWHRQVVSFVEGSRLESAQKNAMNEWGRTGAKEMLLDYNASVLGLPESSEQRVTCFKKNHSTIAKIDPDEFEYSMVLEHLRKWEADAPPRVANEFCR